MKLRCSASATKAYRGRGLVTDGQATLLTRYADTLGTELRALGADPAAVQLDPKVVETLYGDDRGGGGCSMVRGAFDSVLWLMTLAAAAVLLLRRARRRAVAR